MDLWEIKQKLLQKSLDYSIKSNDSYVEFLDTGDYFASQQSQLFNAMAIELLAISTELEERQKIEQEF